MTIPAVLVVASLLLDIAAAIPWPGPMPTPAGLMAMAGMSPRPTDAPGSQGIPQELRKRNVQYPPPENWCGFVTGDYNDVLSCRTQYACAVSGAAVGCCPATTGACDALYTTCYDYVDNCDAACQLDVSAIQCSDPRTPYCGTYNFASGTQLFDCQVTHKAAASVEFLLDFYITAISSSARSLFSGVSFAPASSRSSASSFDFSTPTSISFSTPTYTYSTPAYTSPGYTYTYRSSGISSAAIGGIASGISITVAVVAGLIVFFCVRRRRRMRVAQSQAAARANFPPQSQPPPVQQEQVYPKTAEGGTYQSMSQQEQPTPQYPAPPYGNAAPAYPTEQAALYNPPPAQASETRPPPQEPRPFSTAPSTLAPTNASEIDGHAGDHYAKTPISPTITEVDGHFPSPMHTGSTPTPSPQPAGNTHRPVYEAPPSGGEGPVYEAPPPGGNGPVYEAPPPGGYEAPPPSGGQGGVHEVGNTQQYQGPWEMGHQH